MSDNTTRSKPGSSGNTIRDDSLGTDPTSGVESKIQEFKLLTGRKGADTGPADRNTPVPIYGRGSTPMLEARLDMAIERRDLLKQLRDQFRGYRTGSPPAFFDIAQANYGGPIPSIAGCAFWVRADLGVTLNGSTVAEWDDQSGSGDPNKNLLQGTAANQPNFNSVDGAFNSQPTIGNGGATGINNLVSGTWSTPLAQPATWYQACLIPTGMPVANVYFRLNPSGSSTNCHAMHGGTQDLGLNMNVSDTSVEGSFSAFTGSVAHIVCCVYDASGNGAGYLDSFTTSTFSAASDAGDSCQALFTGTFTGEASQWTTAEIVAYSGIHTLAQRQTVMQYMATRYGVTLT